VKLHRWRDIKLKKAGYRAVWSDEDQLFLAHLDAYADRMAMPCAHGKTEEEAAQAASELLDLMLVARLGKG
jgi:predicted RNase H-like HicB family nuclease